MRCGVMLCLCAFAGLVFPINDDTPGKCAVLRSCHICMHWMQMKVIIIFFLLHECVRLSAYLSLQTIPMCPAVASVTRQCLVVILYIEPACSAWWLSRCCELPSWHDEEWMNGNTFRETASFSYLTTWFWTRLNLVCLMVVLIKFRSFQAGSWAIIALTASLSLSERTCVHEYNLIVMLNDAHFNNAFLFFL
jgi:hypothetical protein